MCVSCAISTVQQTKWNHTNQYSSLYHAVRVSEIRQ